MAAKDVNAKAKAKDIDPVYNEQVVRLRTLADEEQKARIKTDQSAWMIPELKDWDGNLFDWEGMAEAFKREKANEQFEDAHKEGTAPGVGADSIVTTLQVDYLAIMERAFRARHLSRRPRTIIHAMGRKRGHGHNEGTLTQSALEFIHNTIKQGQSS